MIQNHNYTQNIMNSPTYTYTVCLSSILGELKVILRFEFNFRRVKNDFKDLKLIWYASKSSIKINLHPYLFQFGVKICCFFLSYT